MLLNYQLCRKRLKGNLITIRNRCSLIKKPCCWVLVSQVMVLWYGWLWNPYMIKKKKRSTFISLTILCVQLTLCAQIGFKHFIGWPILDYKYLDVLYAVLCLVTQSCPTLCNYMDCSPPGSSVHGDSPGKNTGLGCHALLQEIFPTQGSNPGLPRCRQILYHLRHQGSPSICAL